MFSWSSDEPSQKNITHILQQKTAHLLTIWWCLTLRPSLHINVKYGQYGGNHSDGPTSSSFQGCAIHIWLYQSLLTMLRNNRTTIWSCMENMCDACTVLLPPFCWIQLITRFHCRRTPGPATQKRWGQRKETFCVAVYRYCFMVAGAEGKLRTKYFAGILFQYSVLECTGSATMEEETLFL